jgi:disulfide bond formation protein DsbB
MIALVVALVAAAGSLALTLGMGLKPCPLCYYQRTFVMGVAAVLVLGLLSDMRGSAALSVLAMPLAAAGLGIAGWHVYLEQTGKLECPAGLFDLGTSPQQSLAIQALLFVILAIGGLRRAGLAVAVPIGALVAYFCVISTVSVRLPPEELQGPPKICRPPQSPKG